MAKVLSMHTFELKPECDPQDFEQFVKESIFPIYRKVPGQTAHLLKGDRGERAGKYLLLIEIESVERRDQIYPPENEDGEVVEEVQQLVGNVDSLWETFFTYAEEGPEVKFTDYVMVSD